MRCVLNVEYEPAVPAVRDIMSFRRLSCAPLLSALIMSSAGAALAASGAVTFDLHPLPMALSADEPRAPGTVGYWMPNTYSTVSAATFDVGGGHSRHGEDRPDPTTAYGPPFGEASVDFAAVPGIQGAAHASLAPGHASVGFQSETSREILSGGVFWHRSFALDPFASVTFSGTASVSNPQHIEPVLGFTTDATWPDHYVNSGAVRYSAPGDSDTGMWMQAKIHDGNPLIFGDHSQSRTPHANDFSYSIDSFGVLSLTVHNRSADTLFGTFELDAFANIVPSIPEPATAVMMALGVIATVVRRRSGTATQSA